MKKEFLLLALGVGLWLVPEVSSARPSTKPKIPAAGIYLNSANSPLLDLIKSSTKTIDIEIYTMTDIQVREAIRDVIARKDKVTVRILKDPTPFDEDCHLWPAIAAEEQARMQATRTGMDGGAPVKKLTPSEMADCKDQRKLVDDVIKSGGEYLPFKKDQLCKDPTKYCYQHGKILIADGKTALVSTGNFDETNLCDIQQGVGRCNRDYTVITQDKDVVKSLAAVFEEDLKGSKYDLQSLVKSQLSPKVTVSPYARDQLQDFILSAKKSVWIQTQYLKDIELNQTIRKAASKGVKVTVNVGSPCSFSRHAGQQADVFKQIYQEFDAAGVQSRMFTQSQKINGKNGYMHAKAIVVDEDQAWVGSINGSFTSIGNNREFGVFLDTQKDVNALLKQIQADVADPNSESWQEGLNCVKDGPKK